MDSRGNDPNKEILVYIKNLKKRDDDTEKLISEIKGKIITKDFNTIDDLVDKIKKRLQKILCKV